MKFVLVSLITAAFVAGCAGHSTVQTIPTIANSESLGNGSGPDVGQPGSPQPRWSLVTLSSIFQPATPVLGADNNIWFAGVRSFQHLELGSVTPQGTVKHFHVSPKGAVITATTLGHDGNMWFTVVGPAHIAVGSITPAGIITQYRLPTEQTLDLSGIATGSDGNLWVTRTSPAGIDDEIYKVTTSGTLLAQYKIGTSKLPGDIVLGSDGAMWFVEDSGNAIGRITPTGNLSAFPLPAGDVGPIFVVLAGDGNIWFTYSDHPAGESIGKITPGGVITTYPNPQPETEIDGLTVGPDGALWFPESMGEDHHNTWQLRRITLGGVYDTVDRRIPLEAPFTAPGLGISTGADGDLWVSERHENRFAVWAWRKMTVAPSSVMVGAGQSESIADRKRTIVEGGPPRVRTGR